MRTISMPVATRRSFMPILTCTSCSGLDQGRQRRSAGVIYVLNNLGDKWSGTSVKTKWPNQKFEPMAWDGHDTAHPDERTTDEEGNSSSLPRRAGLRSMRRFRLMPRLRSAASVVFG